MAKALVWTAISLLTGMAQGVVLDKELLAFLPAELGVLGKSKDMDGLVGSGLSVYGNPRRLQAKLARLLDPSAQKLQVFYLGGSITLGHYSAAHGGRVPQELVYVDRVRAWFEGAYPGRSLHHNKGQSATTSDWASACVDSIIDQGADIVFLEYTMNDLAGISKEGEEGAGIDIPSRRGTERLLRRLLSFDNRPAVVVLHAWAPQILERWLPGRPHNDFFTTYEDFTDTLLKYYGIPSLSMRNFIHQVVQSEIPGFMGDDIWADLLHPTPLGHAMLAYCIIDYVRLMIEGLEGSRAGGRGSDGDRLAPPMFPENHHSKGFCGQQGALQRQVWSRDSGWVWNDENDKQGFQAEDAINQTLAIRVELEDSTSGNYTGVLGTMKSWDAYGVVGVSCEEGCECQPLEVDCHDPGSKSTLQSNIEFPMAVTNSSGPCIVRVRLLEKSTSGGHLLKVMSLGAGPAR